MRTILKNVSACLPLLAVVTAARLALAASPAGDPPAGDPIDYGQLGAILGYVASDYATAVGPSQVLSAQEFSEQKGFLSDAAQLARQLPADESEVRALLLAARDAAAAAAPPDQVVPKVTQALALLEQHHDLGQAPRAAPSFVHGKQLFAEACEACHAADGSGHTAYKLSTQPPDLRARKDSGPLSPARIFSAVSYGVPGTAMPAFNLAYADSDRWDLSFYALALAHADTPKDDTALQDFALADLARTSDDDLRASLAKRGFTGPAQERALTGLRADAPYAAAVQLGGGQLLAGARRQVAETQKQVAAGNLPAARHAAISAYLDDFEPYEAALRAKDPALTAELERQFSQLRAEVDQGRRPAPAGAVISIGQTAATLERLLLKAEDAVNTGSASVSFAASLAIALREGLEAALLLSALLALALKSGRRRARIAVHLGWSAALLAGLATWFVSGALLGRSGQNREITEGVTVLLTAVLLLGASHWILAQASAKRLVGFLSHQASLVRGAGWGLGGLAFLAIYREMFEIVVFYRGLLLQAPAQGRAVGAGVLVGLLALVGVVVVFQRVVGHRLKPRPLLITCGALLCGLSIVMVGEGIRSLQEAAVIGQHLLRIPEVPQLGLFATAEGVTAQLLVVVGLGASLAYSLLHAPPAARPTAATANPAA